MSNWEKIKLNEVIDLDTGYPFKSKKFTDNENDIPLVKGSNLQQGYINWEESKRWPKHEYDKFRDYHLSVDDVVLAMDRPWVSAGLKYSWIKESDPDSLLVQRIARLRSKERLNQRFLRYLIASRQFSDYIKPIVTGVNVPHISPDQIKSFEFLLPPKEEQKKIVSILSPIDDLIENNTRRIEILEEMARLIYREWFVHYRYPGHENDRLVDSGTELGEVPEGWEIRTLDNLCELIVGQSPKSEFYNETGKGLPFHQGVKDFESRFPTTTTWCTVQKRIAEKGDILFSVRAPVGRINIANCKMIIGRGLHAIRSKTGNQVFIFEQLKDKFQEEDSMGSGTIYKSVTKGDMLGLKLIYPGKKLIDLFEEKAEPIFDQIRILTEKNIYLKETRDLLLPKLISGKVGV